MMASHYPSSLYTYARNWLIDHETDRLSVPEADLVFEEWAQDLGKELEAAVADRCLEWGQARNAGLPLGEFLPPPAPYKYKKQLTWPGLYVS